MTIFQRLKEQSPLFSTFYPKDNQHRKYLETLAGNDSLTEMPKNLLCQMISIETHDQN